MRVLFVGNSYTFGHEMTEQVARLAGSDPGAPALEVERVAEGGATLKKHFEETGARKRIEEGEFTHVVLQEMSTGTLHDAEAYHVYVGCLGELAKSRKAELLLFQTWARKEGHEIYRWRWSGKGPAKMTKKVGKEVEAAATRLEARVVPVGEIWELTRQRHPELNLHDDDLHHSSPLGAHLTASVFYGALVGRDPTPVPFMPEGVDRDHALLVRALAWDHLRG
ncbi:MAG: DUF4886 domain-containing protein [Myxococcota bacterium]|nr:DUF4886 domain-containing protein [Myxococcota bacterium]